MISRLSPDDANQHMMEDLFGQQGTAVVLVASRRPEVPVSPNAIYSGGVNTCYSYKLFKGSTPRKFSDTFCC